MSVGDDNDDNDDDDDDGDDDVSDSIQVDTAVAQHNGGSTVDHVTTTRDDETWPPTTRSENKQPTGGVTHARAHNGFRLCLLRINDGAID